MIKKESTYFSIIQKNQKMNKKVTIILISLLTMSQLVFSQTNITGKVIDQTDQQPLIGALIQLQSSENGTVTDEQGYFELKNVNDNDNIIIKYLGYEESIIEINAQTSDLGTIQLQRANTTLNEVIVSASPNNYKGDFKGSNFRINPIALKNINPLSTEEVLRTVPGVNIVGDMGLSNRPNISIRGSWGRRSKKVLLMEDGTPSAPAPYIAPGAYYNPVSDRLTAIEVYKGADMLRFG